MWQNTRLLNLFATLLFVIAAIVVARVAVVGATGSALFPLKGAVVLGDVTRIGREEIADAINGRELGNFFGADLLAVREWVEGIPWVRRASVRRVWPDRLEITVEEHRPYARWSSRADGRPEALINTYGEVFRAEYKGTLPLLAGPEGKEAQVLEQAQRFARILQPIGSAVTTVTLSPRLAWQARLANGLTIEIGRDQPGDGARPGRAADSAEQRLARFVRAYDQTLKPLSRQLNVVDLRYPNGFAVRVPDLQQLERDLEREEKERSRNPVSAVAILKEPRQ